MIAARIGFASFGTTTPTKVDGSEKMAGNNALELLVEIIIVRRGTSRDR